MTDIVVDTLRLRGPHARRLTSVAVGPLPAALERALATVADVRLDRVVVTLELDPDDYDDATLAVLWADAIRTGVLAAGATVRTSSDVRTSSPAAGTPLRLWGTAEVLATARTWLAAGASGLPPALLALGDPATARVVAAAAGSTEWARLVAALARTLGHPTEQAPARPAEPPRPDGAPHVPDPVGGVSDREPAAPAAPAAYDPAEETRTTDPRTTPPAADERVLLTLAELAGLTAATGAEVEATTLTRAAGLVLLYPWLADHCRRAEQLHPRLDPLDVRETALAMLVDDDPATLDDPLVALLAGREAPSPGRLRLRLPAAEEVAASADDVIASFAALLPGFEASTAAFVRESWIVRVGLLDRQRDPALLTATTHPLDVLLPLLPYPVGLIKLPWSPPLTVRFRP